RVGIRSEDDHLCAPRLDLVESRKSFLPLRGHLEEAQAIDELLGDPTALLKGDRTAEVETASRWRPGQVGRGPRNELGGVLAPQARDSREKASGVRVLRVDQDMVRGPDFVDLTGVHDRDVVGEI